MEGRHVDRIQCSPGMESVLPSLDGLDKRHSNSSVCRCYSGPANTRKEGWPMVLGSIQQHRSQQIQSAPDQLFRSSVGRNMKEIRSGVSRIKKGDRTWHLVPNVVLLSMKLPSFAAVAVPVNLHHLSLPE